MFLNIIKHLLPNALAWRLTPAKQLREFFQSLANSLQVIKNFFDNMFNEIDPALTNQLDEWDLQFGLPDTGLTTQDRRDRLDGAWKAIGGQDPRYIQDTLRGAGFDVYVHEYWNILLVSNDVSDLDVSTAVYDNNFINVAVEDLSPQGIVINDVGGRLYVVGDLNDFIYQYDLFISGELSSGVYSGLSLDVSSELSTVRHIAVNPDESRIYVGGAASVAEVHQYNVTTPGDLDSASYSTLFVDISAEIIAFRGMAINPAENRMYALNGTDSKIYQYTINNPGDISTAVYSTLSSPVITEDAAQRTIWVSPDEKRLYMIGTGDVVYQYTMTPGDISTLVYSGLSFDVSTEDTQPLGICFNVVETKMYITGNVADKVFEYDLDYAPGPITKHVVTPPLVRDPTTILGGGTVVYVVECGEAIAQCGEAIAEAGEYTTPPGYPLVNKDGSTYTIAVAPNKYPYYFYIGGEVFPNAATVDGNRRDEFEDLCLKICPAHLWLGILVTYS